MLWPLSVVLVANTNGRLAIPALAGLLVTVCSRSADAGGGRGKCATLYKEGGEIVQGELSGVNMSRGNARIPISQCVAVSLPQAAANLIPRSLRIFAIWWHQFFAFFGQVTWNFEPVLAKARFLTHCQSFLNVNHAISLPRWRCW